MAALSHFISRLGEKALPLYRLLRRTEHFEWMDAAMAGLEEIKAILATNPILAAPNVGEPMLLYIVATHQVVSAVLVVEREMDGHKFPLQKPVYCVSTVLTPCKSRYPHYQKNRIRSIYGIPEITTLLSRVFNYGGLRSTTQRHNKQPRCHGPDCQMGHRAPPVRHNI